MKNDIDDNLDADFKEKCWLLYGIRIGRFFIGFRRYHVSGTATGVEMDYKKANSLWVVGWYHTHPGLKSIIPSVIDNKTMRSWVKAKYKPFLCGIICGDMSACYCYYVNGTDNENVTVVSKRLVHPKFYGKIFFVRG